jgi:phosphoribosyl-ATP pyrophosphohydrolase/phosphoribosyl-AMP cyclohydrolase
MIEGQVRWGVEGLVPAVVQDAGDGTVLMLAWMDAEALEATTATGLVHFHSRSRGRLWQKGETSGNVLRVREIRLDCDADAILIRADPAGPTCHTGARSCFDTAAIAVDGGAGAAHGSAGAATADIDGQGFAWLETLWSTIRQRATDRPAGSYTVRLLEGGVDSVARKVAEEAVEVVMAAKDDAADPSATTRSALAGEIADLLYHTLVLAAERGSAPAEVLGVLRARHGSPPAPG